ncbi:MAG: hypothetical protein H0X51_07570 [Parachlamydiaceae bacterium]|nr:hypothetical protein [Parachlamydiaceae bacterium]
MSVISVVPRVSIPEWLYSPYVKLDLLDYARALPLSDYATRAEKFTVVRRCCLAVLRILADAFEALIPLLVRTACIIPMFQLGLREHLRQLAVVITQLFTAFAIPFGYLPPIVLHGEDSRIRGIIHRYFMRGIDAALKVSGPLNEQEYKILLGCAVLNADATTVDLLMKKPCRNSEGDLVVPSKLLLPERHADYLLPNLTVHQHQMTVQGDLHDTALRLLTACRTSYIAQYKRRVEATYNVILSHTESLDLENQSYLLQKAYQVNIVVLPLLIEKGCSVDAVSIRRHLGINVFMKVTSGFLTSEDTHSLSYIKSIIRTFVNAGGSFDSASFLRMKVLLNRACFPDRLLTNQEMLAMKEQDDEEIGNRFLVQQVRSHIMNQREIERQAHAIIVKERSDWIEKLIVETQEQASERWAPIIYKTITQVAREKGIVAQDPKTGLLMAGHWLTPQICRIVSEYGWGYTAADLRQPYR